MSCVYNVKGVPPGTRQNSGAPGEWERMNPPGGGEGGWQGREGRTYAALFIPLTATDLGLKWHLSAVAQDSKLEKNSEKAFSDHVF